MNRIFESLWGCAVQDRNGKFGMSPVYKQPHCTSCVVVDVDVEVVISEGKYFRKTGKD